MRFPDIYTGRAHHAGWSVIQAATLLEEAKARHSSSLLIYTALELRLAIEQLVFTIILVAKGKADQATLRDCRKQGGLFRVLKTVAPQYALKCRFANVLASFYPEIPQGAEWDVKTLQQYHAALSGLCHAQLVIRGMGAQPEQWDEKVALLEQVHAFLAAGMRKDTAVLSFRGATAQAMKLWKSYSSGRISLKKVKERFILAKPLLVSRQLQPRPYPARAPRSA